MIKIGDLVSASVAENKWKLGIVIDCEDVSALGVNDEGWDEVFYQIMLETGEMEWFLLSHVRMIF
jgi:hypothetical protein